MVSLSSNGCRQKQLHWLRLIGLRRVTATETIWVSNMALPPNLKLRNRAIGLALGAMVVLIFLVTIIRIKNGVG